MLLHDVDLVGGVAHFQLRLHIFSNLFGLVCSHSLCQIVHAPLLLCFGKLFVAAFGLLDSRGCAKGSLVADNGWREVVHLLKADLALAVVGGGFDERVTHCAAHP